MKTLTVLLILLAAAPLPTLKLKCDKGNSAATCLNRKVSLEAPLVQEGQGQNNTILQHPILTIPFDPKQQHQGYTQLSSNLGQVVLLSAQPINCPKAELKGTLSQVKQNCGPGQAGKCSYSNYVLRVDSFSCLK